MRLPTNKELKRFVEVEGWENKDQKAHKKTGDHFRYVFTTPTGERLFTRISHGSGQIRNPDLFTSILRDQLCIDEEQFWSAVDKGVRPIRPSHAETTHEDALDAKLARNLINKVGLRPEELVGMTAPRAQQIWQEWLTTGPELFTTNVVNYPHEHASPN